MHQNYAKMNIFLNIAFFLAGAARASARERIYTYIGIQGSLYYIRFPISAFTDVIKSRM